MLAMSQRSCDAFFFDLKPNGILIVDSTFVKQLPTNIAMGIPFTQLAREKLGKEMVANIIALGALATISGVVSLNSLEAAVLNRVPAGTEQLNKSALAQGIEAAKLVLQEKADRQSYENFIDQ